MAELDLTTPEIWKDIPGEPDLRVSSLARVLDTRRPWHQAQQHLVSRDLGGMLLNPRKNDKGYAYVDVREPRCKPRRLLLHRLVLEAFHGSRPAGLEGCHKDDDIENNAPDNLYWGTHRDNMRDCQKNRRNGRTVIYPEVVQEILDKFDGGCSLDAIARSIGVTKAAISMTLVRNGRRTNRKKTTKAEMRQMLAMRESGMTYQAIGETFGAAPTTVFHAIRRALKSSGATA